MSVLAGYKLNSSAAEFAGRTALDLVLSGVTVGADGIDFSTSATNNATIAYANAAPFRVSSAGPLSIHLRLRTGADVLDETFIRSSDHNVNNAGWYVMSNGSGQLEFNYADNLGTGTANRRTWNFGTIAANTDYDINISVTDLLGNATGVLCWVNGAARTATTSGTAGAVGYSTAGVSFGNWARYGTDRNSTHRLRKFAITDTLADSTMVAQWIANPDTAMDTWNSSLSISSYSTTLRRQGTGTLTVSGYAVEPTTLNSTLRIGGATGPALTLTGVSASAGTAVINFSIPYSLAIQNGTSLSYHLTTSAETIESAADVSVLPAVTRGYVNLTSLTTTGNSLVTDHTGFTEVIGDQIEYDLATSSGDTLTVSVGANSVASYSGGALTQNSTFNYRFIRANGTVGADDSYTFNFVSGAIVIVSVNDGNAIPNGDADIPIVISGVNTSAVTGLTINGVAQGYSVASSSILYLNQNAWPNCMYGQTVPLVITTASSSDSENVTLRPRGTNWYVTADGTYNAATAGTITGTTAVAVGDQLEYEYPSSNLVGFTIGGNWIPSFLSGNPGYIRMRILDLTDYTFGNWVNYPFTAASDGTLVENPANPLPASLTLSGAGSTYDLTQHIVNNTGQLLQWSVFSGGSALPAGVTLNATTGVLSFNGAGSQTVTGIYFNVEPI